MIESHGISVLHALKEGLPCVVSDKGGLPESVQEGVTGYIVSSSDIEGCADKLLRLVENAALREEMGDAGKKRYTKFFLFKMASGNDQGCFSPYNKCYSRADRSRRAFS